MDETQTLSDYAAGEIRAILARRRSTGKDLAAQLNVSRSWVSYRLTGTTEITLNDLQRIAEALDVPIIDLIPTTQPAGKPRGGSIRFAEPAPELPQKAEMRVGRGTPQLTEPPILTPIRSASESSAATARTGRPVRLSQPATGGGQQ